MALNKKTGPKTPDDHFVEQATKDRALAKEREEVADFQREEIDLQNAEQSNGDAAFRRPLRRHVSTKRKKDISLRRLIEEGNLFAAGRTIAEVIGLAALMGMFTTHAQNTSAVAPAPAPDKKAPQKPEDVLHPQYDDGEYVYDAMFVSQPVHQKLSQEAAIIATKVAELEAIRNPRERDAMERKIESLATEFEMRMHPLSEAYVHDYNRVLREEQLYGGHEIRCEFNVCVFVHKSQIDGLRGIKAKIGDPYNQDPQEVIAAGDHLKGTQPAAPAPHLV